MEKAPGMPAIEADYLPQSLYQYLDRGLPPSFNPSVASFDLARQRITRIDSQGYNLFLFIVGGGKNKDNRKVVRDVVWLGFFID